MNLIVVVDKKWGIGKDGGLLCHLKGDMKYFREKTLGKVVIMGRSTLESFPNGKPLKDRVNIVLTRQENYAVEGVTVVNSMEELFSECNKYDPDNVMIIGGSSVYNELMNMCDRLYITKIDAELDADTFIHNVDLNDNFKVVWESDEQEENGIRYKFFEYRRVLNRD